MTKIILLDRLKELHATATSAMPEFVQARLSDESYRKEWLVSFNAWVNNVQHAEKEIVALLPTIFLTAEEIDAFQNQNNSYTTRLPSGEFVYGSKSACRSVSMSRKAAERGEIYRKAVEAINGLGIDDGDSVTGKGLNAATAARMWAIAVEALDNAANHD